jgi:DNA-binding transcriptional LysR family regulator
VPLIFGAGGNTRQVKLPAMVTVTGPETNVACASMGLGLIQVPRYRVASELARGALVKVLAGFPPSRCPSTPSTPIRGNCRRACGCS